MKKKFFSGSLRNRLVLYFTILVLVPLVSVGYLIYVISDTRMSDNALLLSQQILEKNAEEVNGVLLDMQRAAKMVTDDEEIQAAVSELLSALADGANDSRGLNQRLRSIHSFFPSFNGIYLILDNQIVGKSRYYSVREELSITPEMYLLARNHADPYWVNKENGSLVVDNMGDQVLSMLVSLASKETGQPCGIVVIEVKKATFEKMMRADLGANGTVFLVNAANELVISQYDANEDTIAPAIERSQISPASKSVYVTAEKDRFILRARLPINGWAIVGVVFKEFIQQNSHQILSVILLVAFLSFIIIIIVARSLSDYELKPIHCMIDFVRLVEKGEFDSRLALIRNDEIGELTTSIQAMTQHIKQLLSKVKSEQERLRISEYKALQAQINPHFLYNTLDSVNWLAQLGDIQRTRDMVSALTTFYRIGLSRGREVISVQEEITHAQNYLFIQKIRYADQFDYFVYVDPCTESCYVPKLILQPLVENALYHGIKLCQQKCRLLINVLEQGDDLLIEVIDNGAGMDANELQALQNAITRTGDIRTKSYGVMNVHDRIRILAGEAYGLCVESEKNVGTSVTIRLPKTLGSDS